MTLTIREAHHFIFEGWAVSRPNSRNLAVEKRGLVDVAPYQVMHTLIRMHEIAVCRVDGRFSSHERERQRLGVSVFHVEHTPVDAILEVNSPSRQPGWSSGLEA